MTGDEIVKAHRAFLVGRVTNAKSWITPLGEGRLRGLEEALDHLTWLEEAEGDEGRDEIPS